MDLFMFTDIMISYCDNKMTINYNSLINTVKELDANDIINRYDILLSLTDLRERAIKMYVGKHRIKDNMLFDYTTIYDIRVILLDDNDNCIIKSIEVKDD